MDSSPQTPLFTPGYEIANVLASSGTLLKAWKEITSNFQNRKYRISEYDGNIYVAFPSFQEKEHFIVPESPYGEVNIRTESNIFSSIKDDDDQPALVHQGAFKLFSSIIKEEDFKKQMDPRSTSKPVIFIGHSIGGAVASLATLWMLKNRKLAFCITFGTPLFGDSRFSQAISRENWTGNFCHVVSKRDFVPHFLSATSELIDNPLTYLLPCWKGEIRANPGITEAVKPFVNNILFKNTLLVDNPYTDSITDAPAEVRESPYRPFGSYIFCSEHGATSFQNTDTIFRMLHLMIADPETSLAENYYQCIQEHIDYGTVLQSVMEKSKTGKIGILLQSDSLSYECGISLQRKVIGIESERDHALAFIKKAGVYEERLARNIAKTSYYLIEAQQAMSHIEWYKCHCSRDSLGYYDSFKTLNARRDIRANKFRTQLENTWNDIIKMWKMKELPRDFQTQNKYINAGNAYRRLVEPLDIAIYYRKCGENGDYLRYGRPERYRVLEKWLLEKEMNRQSRGKVKTHSRTKLPSLTMDSCFWAYVEEALKALKQWQQAENVQKLAKFEKYVETLIQEQTVCGDIFLEGSSFMQWWEQYKVVKGREWVQGSSLCRMIETHLEAERA